MPYPRHHQVPVCRLLRRATNKRVLLGLFMSLLFVVAGRSYATVINVDIDGRLDGPQNTDDGVFSSPGGTTWNEIGLDFLNNVNKNNIDNEFGIETTVDLTFDANGSLDANARALELYAGGGTGILDIKSLSATGVYNLAIYTTNPNFSVDVIDALGTTSQSTGSSFAVELPGDENEEYLIFNSLLPYDLGSGVFGLRIETTGPTRMAGFQLESVVPEPSSMALAVMGLFALLFVAHRRHR